MKILLDDTRLPWLLRVVVSCAMSHSTPNVLWQWKLPYQQVLHFFCFLDLYGLFLFLGVEPYYRRTWWKKLLYEPFLRGDIKPLSDVLRNVMWRSAKKDVVNEVGLQCC